MNEGWRWRGPALTAALTILRVALGAVFLISSISKLQYPDLFIEAVQNYSLLPEGLGELFGTVLPWAEMVIGWCLVLGIFPTIAAALTIPLVLSFMVANISSFFRDVGEACGCLGNLVNMSHTTSLIMDIAMLAAAALLIWQRKRAGVVGIGHLLGPDRLRLPRFLPAVLGIVTLVAAVLITASLIPEHKEVWEEDIDRALERDSLVVAFLWQGDSADFMEEFRMIMDLTEFYGNSVHFQRIDAGLWPEAAEEFDVEEFPAMLIIEGTGKKGYELYPERFAGAEDRDALMAAIDQVLSG